MSTRNRVIRHAITKCDQSSIIVPTPNSLSSTLHFFSKDQIPMCQPAFQDNSDGCGYTRENIARKIVNYLQTLVDQARSDEAAHRQDGFGTPQEGTP